MSFLLTETLIKPSQKQREQNKNLIAGF